MSDSRIECVVIVKMAGSRLTWGKWASNNGQACIAPDYLLVEESILPELVCFEYLLVHCHSVHVNRPWLTVVFLSCKSYLGVYCNFTSSKDNLKVKRVYWLNPKSVIPNFKSKPGFVVGGYLRGADTLTREEF
jgi:hypothetical protein